MDKKPCFSSVVLGLGAITWELVRHAESQAPPAPKSASSHTPKGFLGTIKSEMLWAIINTVKKTQLLFLFSFKSFPQPSPSFRLRLTYSPILPQILLL